MDTGVPWQELFDAAARAQSHAYAPYSRFPVGAAVLAEDGRIFSGCNVENASFGLTVCAERNAIGQLLVQGAQRIRAVAIVANAAQPTPPCGMCRQVIAEFAAPDTPVRYRGPSGDEGRYTLQELLPHAFTKEFL